MKNGALWEIKWIKTPDLYNKGERVARVVVPWDEENEKGMGFIAVFSLISHYVKEEHGGILLGAWPVTQIEVLVEDWTPSESYMIL